MRNIGRKRAKEISIRLEYNHKSFALSVIEKRLEIFKKQYNHTTVLLSNIYMKTKYQKG